MKTSLNCGRVTRKRSHARGFTLLELLAVMAIIGLLIGLTTTGTSFLGSRALVKAGTQVTMLLDFARQHAMSSNRPTAVVLVTGSGTPDDGRAFSVYDYTLATGWKQIRPWEYLSEGCCVEMGSGTAEGLPTAVGITLRFKNDELDAGKFASRVFLPSGGLLDTNGTPAKIRLIEGEVVNGVAKPRRSNPNYYRIALVTATGRSIAEY